MRRRGITEGALAGMLFVACRGDTTPPMMEEVRAVCPMIIEGTEVELGEIDGGIALAFITERGDVPELRRRVEAMGGMYQRHAGRGRMMWHHVGERGPHHRPGSLRGAMPAVRTEVEAIERGARILMRPVHAEDLASIREHARAHRERMRSGECWLSRADVRGEVHD